MSNNPNDNQWSHWQSKHSSYMERYDTEPVVVVVRGKTTSIRLSRKVIEHLGKPIYIRVLTRGNNIAFLAGNKDEGDYAVSYGDEGGFQSASISVIALVKAFDLAPGAYTGFLENGMYVFDSMQKPSRI